MASRAAAGSEALRVAYADAWRLAVALTGTQVIASGRSTVVVRAGASTRATITLTPTSPPGQLTVTSIFPAAGPSDGATVTLTGTDFATSGTVMVTFGALQATSVSVSSPTTLTCTSPPGAVGVVDVTVTNPDHSSAGLPGAYTYYLDTPIIMTVAGTGVAGFSGDGGPATAARVDFPWDVQVDASGSLVFADTHNYRLRRIDAATGLISTFAGTGAAGATGDGGPASAASVNPVALDFGPDGDLYLMDAGASGGRLLRRISWSTGNISLVRDLSSISIRLLGFVLDSAGNVYMSQWYGPAAVFKMDPMGSVTTISTGLSALRSVALSPDENSLYASNQNDFDIPGEGHKVKRITLSSGTLANFAGTGNPGFSGDGGPASAALLNTPWFVSTDPAGNVFICDRGNNRIRVVDAGTGIITTVVGDGTAPTASTATLPRGDGGPPLNAQIQPIALCTWKGDIYFAETDFARIRRVTTAPNPTGISPPSGPAGTTVTLSGTNFKPGATVTFGGVPAEPVQVMGPTQLVCTVPSGVGGAMPVPVVVRNQGTTTSVLARAFTVVP